ncbi:Tyrosine-protein kinase Fer [Orchesella cincta]|uniref:Tyrosine-protein kinase Fer n=1 Tax=Orchesella cincta TaxID=48709 RepID=A0A1D2MUX6_ORCCI|nr:Tyrosine-protein kinase Fer [Orchesella cincta]
MSSSKGISVRSYERSNVTFTKEIGSGTFGKVFLATIKDSKLPQVAIKIFKKELRSEVSQKDKDNAYEELLKVAVIDHENIVKLHGMVQESELPWLVFEFMKGGNLLEYVLKTDNIKEKTLSRFCRDICNGMTFLHNHRVLHKDLAARNILLDGKTAKIADLGLSSFLTSDEGGVYALNGKLFPYRHAAVECIVEQVFTFESDVWSFGILMYEIFMGGMTPYGKENKQPEVRRFIVDGITPLHLLQPNCSSKIISIMKSILTPLREDRPTFEQLLTKFQKMLTGKSVLERSSDNLATRRDSAGAGFAAFHKIKANGLSSSFTNLSSPLSSSPTSNNMGYKKTITNENQGPKTNRMNAMNPMNLQLLTVSQNSKSTSTPNLVEAIAKLTNQSLRQADKILQKTSDNHLLSVRSNPSARRHSSQINVIPLAEQKMPPIENTSTYKPLFHDDFDEQSEPRKRASSSSRVMNNPLLEGFVQNRFIRKT